MVSCYVVSSVKSSIDTQHLVSVCLIMDECMAIRTRYSAIISREVGDKPDDPSVLIHTDHQ